MGTRRVTEQGLQAQPVLMAEGTRRAELFMPGHRRHPINPGQTDGTVAGTCAV